MSTYKMIQDIEAEDHIIGNLSLRQFIYALVAAFLYYLSFFFFTKGVAFLLVITAPPALFFSFFAFPFGKDQSTEVWALAKLRFLLKPRTRIWDQSGLKELVTITVPKKIERILTDGLGQDEVKSRLNALASTLDSRGWAIKNVNTSAFSYTDPFGAQVSDRLVDISSMPREVPNDEVYASDDVLDAYSSPVAQQFETMINRSEKAHRQDIINRMNSASHPVAQQQKPADYWFMNQPPSSAMAPNETMFAGSPSVQPFPPANDTTSLPAAADATEDEKAIVQRLKEQSKKAQPFNSRLRTLQPIGSNPAPVQTQQQAPPQPAPITPVTPPRDPAIIQALAGNNDLDIATLARQAKKEMQDDGEVVISLH